MADPAARERPLSIEEYLDLEETSPVRHEYVAGQLYTMTGTTRRHNEIVLNIAIRLRAAARSGPCHVYVESVKVRAAGDVVYYPDVVVTCDPTDDDPLIVHRPCLVVEVLSPSTRVTDQREKAMVYKTMASLGAYLIIDQEQRLVERHWRDRSGEWRRTVVTEHGDLPLPCPELPLTLDEVYEGVELPPSEERLRVREEEAAYR